MHTTRPALRSGLLATLSTLAILCSTPAQAATEVIAGNLKAAENSLQTANQRIFVTADGGLFELKKNGNGWTSSKLAAQFKDGRAASCYFLGITENAGMVYTLCAENLLNPLAKKHLFGFDSRQAGSTPQQIGELSGVDFPNGLSADQRGTLYIANSGLPLLAGKIHKLVLATPTSIGTQSVLHQFVACKPNGVHYDKGRLYVSLNPFSYIGLSQLLRYDVSSNGLVNQLKVYSSWGFLDDFALVKGGLVVSQFISGKITQINENGDEIRSAGFNQPTSINLLQGNGGMLVTERGAGQVKWTNDWQLEAR